MKNVFVLDIDEYRPDLTRYTFPSIQAYADKIGAKLNFIKDRAWPDFPVSLEKLRIGHLGEGADWNILIDADTLIHPDTPDFTKGEKGVVRFAMGTDVRHIFPYHPWFERCGHYQGIAGNFIVTSSLTHDLWQAPDEDVSKMIRSLKRPFNVDEFILSLNLARYGLRFDGLLPAEKLDRMVIHFGNDLKSDDERSSDANRARALSESWGYIQ